MSDVLSPYRESDGPALAERACPTCGAHVSYEVGATSATCSACDTQFAIAVDHLSKGEPRVREPDAEPGPKPLPPRALEPRGLVLRARRAPQPWNGFEVGFGVGAMLFICVTPIIGLSAAAVLGGVGWGLSSLIGVFYAKRRKVSS